MTRLFGFAALSVALTSVAAATLGGCSSSSSDANDQTNEDAGNTSVDDAAPASIDADNGTPSTQYPAPHPAIAQVRTFGGPIIAAPHVVPVFFPGDEYEAQLETYLQQLAANESWASSTSEYGVGAMTIGASLVLADAPLAKISETDVDTLMKQVGAGTASFQAGHGPTAATDSNTVYALFFPTSTIIEEAPGYDSCQSFGGYHADATVDVGDGGAPIQFAYAMVPRCPTFYQDEGLTGVDEVTAGLSHELAEAFTDPFSEVSAAYLAADDDHKVYGVVLAASELGGMCSWEMPSVAKPAAVDFQTSRIWSNAAALAGHDPCLPAPSEPYFATVPDLPDQAPIPEYESYGANGQIVAGGTTKGLRLKVGETKTIDLVLYCDGPTSGPWTVEPQEIVAAGQKPALTLSLDRQSGVNGEKLHLTVTRNTATRPGHGNSILIYSSIGSPTAMSRLSLAMAYVTQ
ncbi:MAG: hypothetical protein ABI183_03530 [Polyangiaceae bacterium]